MTSPLEQVDFWGTDYVEARDRKRLTGQLKRVYNVYADGRWHSTQEASEIIYIRTGHRDKESSVARQMRYLRDLPDVTLEKRHVKNGLFEYRMRKLPRFEATREDR